MPIEWPDALPYAQLRLSSCHSVRTNAVNDFNNVIMESAAHLNEVSSIDLWSSVQAQSNPGDTVDMAMRMYTGCGASKDILGAMGLLRSLVDPEAVSESKIPRSVKARALSLQGRMHFDHRFERKGAINIDVVYRAAQCANAAAALGFVSPDVLQIASHVETIGFRRPEDNKFKEHSTERFEKLADLWDALDMRKEALQREDDKQAAKVAEHPELYLCAARGCGIESKSKSGLSACGGKCPAVIKPAYCSKECQRKDWKRHKPLCRADVTDAEVLEALEQIGSEDQGEATAVVPADGPGMQSYPDGVNTSGKEYSLQVQGGERLPNKISTTTMNPAFLKEIKEHIENRAQQS